MKSLFLLLALTATTHAAGPGAPAASAPQAATATAPEGDNEVVARRICMNGAVERTLEVLPVEKGCVLRYTKGGKTEEKAKASHGVQICQDSMQRIAARLETSGFKCQ